MPLNLYENRHDPKYYYSLTNLDVMPTMEVVQELGSAICRMTDEEIILLATGINNLQEEPDPSLDFTLPYHRVFDTNPMLAMTHKRNGVALFRFLERGPEDNDNPLPWIRMVAEFASQITEADMSWLSQIGNVPQSTQETK